MSRDIGAALVKAMEVEGGWGAGTKSSKDYPQYEDHMRKIRETTFDSMLEGGSILAGTPDDISRQLATYRDAAGDFDCLSLQVNFHLMTVAEAAASMRLFAQGVMPNFV